MTRGWIKLTGCGEYRGPQIKILSLSLYEPTHQVCWCWPQTASPRCVCRKTWWWWCILRVHRADTTRSTSHPRCLYSWYQPWRDHPQTAPSHLHMKTHDTLSWWRHQMATFSALLALCAGNSPVPVNSLHKGQWRGALMFSLICVWINGWVNNREAGDLSRHRGHYDVIIIIKHGFH